MRFGTRILLSLILIIFFGAIFYAVEVRKSDSNQIIFCDVGQGDGFVVFGSGGNQIVFDGGLGGKLTDCLGRYMPVWDRKIEVMVLTHPQRDHMEGQIEMLGRYQVERVIWTGAGSSGGLFDEWKSLVSEEGAQIYETARGDRIELGDLNLEVLWPSKSFMDLWKLAPGGDLNETSVVMRMNFGGFCAYFTGDIPVGRLGDVADKNCRLLKVAHHGSKTGTNDIVLEKVKPEIAVIQVGKNSYGHPHGEVLESLNKFGVDVLRNDVQGDVVIRFDRAGIGAMLEDKP